MSARQEPPIMWTRCHQCGKTVRTDECVREKREIISYRGGIGNVRVGGKLHQEGMVDVCLRCKEAEKRAKEIELEEEDFYTKIFRKFLGLFQSR